MSKVDETGDISANISLINKKTKPNNFSKLTNLRIIQKQLVYVIGLSYNYAFNEVKKTYLKLTKNKIFSLFQTSSFSDNTEKSRNWL